MKKNKLSSSSQEKSNKIIVRFLLLLLFPFVVIIFYTLSQLGRDTSFSVVTYDHGRSVYNQAPSGELIKGKKIIGIFQARDDNLGTVLIRFTNFGRQNIGKMRFAIKEEAKTEWIYSNTYETHLIYGVPFFPFGFPVISNSKGKEYLYEITIIEGKKGSAVGLDMHEPVVATKHQFDKQKLLSNKSMLMSHLYKKSIYILKNSLFVWTFLISYLFFVILMFFAQKQLTQLILSIKILFQKVFVAGESFNNRSIFLKLFRNRTVVIILLVGLGIRLILATTTYNFDIVQWIEIGKVMRKSLNIYANNEYYNYSPLYFFLLGFLDFLYQITSLPMKFLTRAFLSIIDVVAFFVMGLLCFRLKRPLVKTLALFFLNPVSIIITGRHGQFDNIPLLFLLFALLAYSGGVITRTRTAVIWALLSFGFLFKHIILFQVLLFYRSLSGRLIIVFLLLGATLAVFLLSLMPFFFESRGRILSGVLQYGGLQGLYGFSYIIKSLCLPCENWLSYTAIYRYAFVAMSLIFTFLLPKKDLLRSILLSILFFLTFTSGISAQYFVLPIALGAFYPTKWFYLYTIVTTLFFMGSVDEFNIPLFQTFTWNTVWLFVCLWFFSELMIVFPAVRKIYNRIIS